MNGLEHRLAIVAGNGTSVTRLPPGMVLADDFIVRINNFYFETRHHLGQRVDLAFMGGDPRVAPFMFETLYRCTRPRGGAYDLRGWSTHGERIVRAGQQRFGRLFRPMQYGSPEIRAGVQALMARYQRHPTTGIYAVLMAQALGARHILLTGMDFHSGPRRYPFELGPNYRALMGQDLNQRGVDLHLHDTDLDRAILELVASQEGVQLLRSEDNPVLNMVCDPAPLRTGVPMATPAHVNAPTDWASFSGMYPILALRVLRKLRRWQSHLRRSQG